jgi:hypothetical protein
VFQLVLTKKEFDIFQYLVLNKNRVITRLQLTEHIWGDILEVNSDSNFIDVHVRNLRKKLDKHTAIDWFETVTKCRLSYKRVNKISVKIKHQLAIFNALTRLLVILVLWLMLPILVENVVYRHINNGLLEKKQKFIHHLRSK